MPLDRRFESERPARLADRACIGSPRISVKIDGKDTTGVAAQQRIDPHDLLALKVGEQLAFIQPDERLADAGSAANLRLPADTRPPLIPTARRVARSTAFVVIPADREHILSPAEQIPEEPDLGCWRELCRVGLVAFGRSGSTQTVELGEASRGIAP